MSNHAVIGHFQLSGGDFGSEDERAAFYEFGHRLTEAIDRAGVGEFDGNEFGEGEAVFYAYGANADQLFAAIEPIVRAFPPRPAHFILRYGDAADPDAREVRIDL